MHKNQCNLKSRNEKKKFETNCRFDVFQKCTTHFSLLVDHFLSQPNEALLVLKDLQPNRPDKVTYLANHKKMGCGRGPSCQPLHVQYSSDGSRSLTTLTTPCREHQGSGRR